MKLINVKDVYAKVDDNDYEWLNRWVWRLDSEGYAYRRSKKNGKRKEYRMHRDVLKPLPGIFTDHINGDRLDNRRSNLRICTNAENMWNSNKSFGLSKHKGVDYSKKMGKWRARICCNGKRIWLGHFNTDTEAAAAYNEAALKYHGEFAKLNTIDNSIHIG